jgi:hypothetical protein
MSDRMRSWWGRIVGEARSPSNLIVRAWSTTQACGLWAEGNGQRGAPIPRRWQRDGSNSDGLLGSLLLSVAF